MVFRFLPQDGTAVSLLRAGEVDLISTDGLLNADMAKELDGLAAAGFQVYRTPSSIWDHVDLNTTRFPFDDLRVRRALAYATGKQALAQQVHAGNVPVADSFLPETHWAYGGAGIQRYPYSLEDARALLAQAGWDCGKTPCTRQAANGTVEKLAFTLSTTDRADRQQIAQVLARQWAQAGFGVDVQILYGRGLFQPANQGGPLAGRNFDAALYTWVLGDNPAIDGLYACRSIPTKENGFTGLNYSGWCSPQSDAMVVSAGRDPDVLADRMRWRGLLAGVQAAWSADVPVIPLYHGVMISAARPGLRGYKPSLQPNSTELWNVWQWDVER